MSLIVPSREGRLGDMVSDGLEDTAALPLDEDEGLDRLEPPNGLEDDE